MIQAPEYFIISAKIGTGQIRPCYPILTDIQPAFSLEGLDSFSTYLIIVGQNLWKCLIIPVPFFVETTGISIRDMYKYMNIYLIFIFYKIYTLIFNMP